LRPYWTLSNPKRDNETHLTNLSRRALTSTHFEHSLRTLTSNTHFEHFEHSLRTLTSNTHSLLTPTSNTHFEHPLRTPTSNTHFEHSLRTLISNTHFERSLRSLRTLTSIIVTTIRIADQESRQVGTCSAVPLKVRSAATCQLGCSLASILDPK
jgi:hypothetical protein